MGRRGPAAGAWRGQRGRGGVPRGERSVWNLQRRLNENYHRLEMLLREPVDAGNEAALRLRLAVLAEARRHLMLAQSARAAAARTEAVRQFQEAVLAALGRADPRLREEVMAALEAAAPADSPIAPAEAGR